MSGVFPLRVADRFKLKSPTIARATRPDSRFTRPTSRCKDERHSFTDERRLALVSLAARCCPGYGYVPSHVAERASNIG